MYGGKGRGSCRLTLPVVGTVSPSLSSSPVGVWSGKEDGRDVGGPYRDCLRPWSLLWWEPTSSCLAGAARTASTRTSYWCRGGSGGGSGGPCTGWVAGVAGSAASLTPLGGWERRPRASNTCRLLLTRGPSHRVGRFVGGTLVHSRSRRGGWNHRVGAGVTVRVVQDRGCTTRVGVAVASEVGHWGWG